MDNKNTGCLKKDILQTMKHLSKITIVGSILVSLNAPSMLFAGISLVTPVSSTMQARVSWYAVNGHGCGLGGPGNTGITSNLDGTSQSKVYFRSVSSPTSETHTIGCTGAIGSNYSGMPINDSANLTVTGTAPTTAPFLSITTTSGTVTTPWTLNWSGGNNSPTYYEMQITGAFFMSWSSQGPGVTSNGPHTIAEFGLGAGIYNFVVRACNSAGCGPASNMVSFTASAPAPTVNINFSMKLDEVKRKLHQMFSRNETTIHPLASSLR